MNGNIIRKILVDEGDITFYFEDSTEPFSSREFDENSLTKRELRIIEHKIKVFNSETHTQEHNAHS